MFFFTAPFCEMTLVFHLTYNFIIISFGAHLLSLERLLINVVLVSFSRVGGHPRCFRAAGEEAQNSWPGAQRLGYHHRHRAEGKHLRHSRCELNAHAD